MRTFGLEDGLPTSAAVDAWLRERRPSLQSERYTYLDTRAEYQTACAKLRVLDRLTKNLRELQRDARRRGDGVTERAAIWLGFKLAAEASAAELCIQGCYHEAGGEAAK